MAQLKIDVTADSSNAIKGFQQVQDKVAETSKQIEQSGMSIEQMFNRIKTAASVSLAGFSVKEFVTKCATIRGEFQQLEAAFTTLLGNAEKAQTMMDQLTNLAATTPFDMKGVASSAKQLIAYGVAADDVVDTMRRLGDIAAGLSLNLSDLAWLYGTTLTQGRMFTMDLRQFQSRGIPMADELAKIFGVTKDQVAGLVTAGKVGSKEVTQAIKNMTDEGSKFGGLMEMQSHTITGQWSNIQDTIEMAFNDLGKQQEGIINDALSLTSLLIDHWKEIGSAILTVVSAYGVYKAALLTTTAIQNAQRSYRTNTEVSMLDQEIAKYQELIPAKQAVANADLQEAVAKGQLTQAQAELIASKREELEVTQQQAAASQLEGDVNERIAALQALKAANDESIDADLREAVASGQITQAQAQEIQSKRELITALQQEAQERVNILNSKAYEAQMELQNAKADQSSAQSAVEEAQEKIQAARDAMDAAMESGDADEMAAAKTEMGTAVNEAYTAQQQLKAANERVATAEVNANSTAEAANAAQQQLNTTMTGVNTTSKVTNTGATNANTTATLTSTIATKAASAAQAVFALAIDGVKKAWNAMKVAMMTNPIGAILGVVSLAIGAFMTFADTTDEATQASEKFGESADKEIGNVNVLISTLQNIGSTTKTYHDALDELNKECEKYNLSLLDENATTAELIKKKEELIEKINEERDARVKANAIDTMQKSHDSEVQEADDEFLKHMKNAEHLDDAGVAYWDSDDIQSIADGLTQTLNAKIKSEIPDIVKLDGDARQKAVENLRSELSKIMTDAGVSDYNASFVKGSFDWSTGNWNDALYEQIDALIELQEKWQDNTDVVTEYNDKVEQTAPTLADQYGQSAETMTEFFNEMEREMYTGEATASDYSGMLSALVPEDLDPTGAFEKLHTMEDVVKQKIDEINARPVHVDADYTNLYGLNNMLIEIQNRINNIANLNGGAKSKNDLNTIAGIQAELKDVNEKISTAQIGSQSYKDLVKYRDNLKKKIPNDATYHKPKTPKKPKSNSSAETEANQAAARAERLRSEQEKWDEQLADEHQQALFTQREADIATIKDNAEKERAEKELQHDKDLYQLQQQELSYKKANYQHNKTIYENSGKGKKNRFSGSVKDTALTSDQQKDIDAQRRKIEAEWNAYREKQQKAELKALYDYYKEYGSYEQKKLALTQEYAEKIKEASTEGERMSLSKERDKALSNLSYENVSKGIDWKSMFSSIGSMSIQLMEQLLPKLEAYTKTDKFQGADSQSQKDVVDLINYMRQYVDSDQQVTWQDLEKAMVQFNFAVSKNDAAKIREQKAVSDRDTAQANMNAAKTRLDKGEISHEEYQKYVDQYNDAADAAKKAGDFTAKTTENVEKFGNTVTNLSDQLANKTDDLTKALNKLHGWDNVDGFDDLKNASSAFGQFTKDIGTALADTNPETAITGEDNRKFLNGMQNTIGAGLSAMGDGIESVLGSGIGQVVGFVAQIPRLILQFVNAIKSFVTGILDSLTELISLRWIDDLVDSILEAVGNLINAIFDLPENLYHVIESIVVKGVGGLLNTVLGRVGNILSLGALSSKGPSDWFTNSNAKEVAKRTQELTDSNDALKTSVDNLKSSIDKESGVSAVEDYQEAYANQQSINEQTMEILKTQMRYHGSHHSNAHYWDLSREDYAAINETLAKYAANNPTVDTKRNSVGSLSDIYELTPEQMQAISAHNVEIWQKMLNQGKYDKSEYWQNYIELAGQLEQLTEKINENLTQTSFESLHSSFVSSIMDMKKDAGDFADEFSEMMAKAFVNAEVGNIMDSSLKEFYDSWATKMKAGTLTNDDINQMRSQYMDLVEQAIQIRSTMEQVTGYTGSDNQTAFANGVTSITYDQANTFIGLVTAGNIITQQIGDNMVKAVVNLAQITGFTSSANSAILEIRNLMIYNNSYLEDVVKYSKAIYTDFAAKIDQANKYLKEMK